MKDSKKYQIFITSKAINQIKQQLQNRENYNLRLGVRGSGCNGFSYVFQYEDFPVKDKDYLFIIDGINVIIDKKSIIYLNNFTLDWEHTLMQQRFIFNNNNVESLCGCGKSFSMKENK